MEQTRVVERPQPDDSAIPSPRILPGQDCDTCSEQAVPSLRDFDLDVFLPDEGAAQNIDISRDGILPPHLKHAHEPPPELPTASAAWTLARLVAFFSALETCM